MADHTKAGERRMALALRTMEAMDYEATGQYLVTRPKRRAIKVLATTGKVAGKSCLMAGKGAWYVTRWLFTPREREIHVIVRERGSSVDEVVACIVFLLLIVGVLAVIGSSV